MPHTEHLNDFQIRTPPSGQVEFIDAMLQRTNFADSNSVRVCILDTGVERGHLLLRDSLSERDTQAWDIEWGSDDHSGHGTELAGICLYGPKLSEALRFRRTPRHISRKCLKTRGFSPKALQMKCLEWPLSCVNCGYLRAASEAKTVHSL